MVESSGCEPSMAALAFALAEHLSPRSASTWRIVFFLPLTIVVTSALAVASDLQSPFSPLVAVEELLDDELAFADVDTDVSSAEAMQISNVPVPIAINPPIVPAAASTAGSGQRLNGRLRIA
jgi:hypothetical protein